jgi:hypothetical protein
MGVVSMGVDEGVHEIISVRSKISAAYFYCERNILEDMHDMAMPKEVMEITHVCHGKRRVQCCYDALKENC